MKNNTCVYRHIRLDKNEVFYIGIGSKERAYTKINRNKHWNNIIKKTDYEIQILKSDLTWNDACELEKILISYYGRKDLSLGSLVNMTNGGDGISGNIRSSETIEKIRKSNTGKRHSDKTKEKLRLFNINKKLSDETKLKIGLANIGGKNCKARKIINIKTLEIFDSLREAADNINMNKHTLCNQLAGYNKNKTDYQYYEY